MGNHDVWQYYCDECKGEHVGECTEARKAAQRAYDDRIKARGARYAELCARVWDQVNAELPVIQLPGVYES